MAFFERADERDPLILCNICEVKCSERSITSHRMKCAQRKPDQFKSRLTRCSFDSGHIVERAKMDIHLEFCRKRQTTLVDEFQKIQGMTNPNAAASTVTNREPVTFDDEWQPEPESDLVIAKLSKLKLK